MCRAHGRLSEGFFVESAFFSTFMWVPGLVWQAPFLPGHLPTCVLEVLGILPARLPHADFFFFLFILVCLCGWVLMETRRGLRISGAGVKGCTEPPEVLAGEQTEVWKCGKHSKLLSHLQTPLRQRCSEFCGLF